MKLQDLKDKKPTDTWREYISDDDTEEDILEGFFEEDSDEDSEEVEDFEDEYEFGDLYPKESISETDRVLDDFIDDLISLGEEPNENEIMECVKKVVMELNDLNERYDYFIETMEREDLCDFINEAAQIAGLEPKDDITEEWRDF